MNRVMMSQSSVGRLESMTGLASDFRVGYRDEPPKLAHSRHGPPNPTDLMVLREENGRAASARRDCPMMSMSQR